MTINKIPLHMVDFASKTDFYAQFSDYFAHEMKDKYGIDNPVAMVDKDGNPIDRASKKTRIEKAFHEEIARVQGTTHDAHLPLTTRIMNPMYQYAVFAVVSAAIDVVVPQIVMDGISYYSDVHNIAWGDTAQFDVQMPRDYFVVSKAGRAVGQSFVRKQYTGEVLVNPEYRQISVGVDLYRVLAGQESLSNFVFKAAKSLAADIQRNTYNTFNTALTALTSPLKVTGWSVTGFTTLAQKLQAWNDAPVVALGTKTALANITPSDANYRYDIQSPFARFGYMNDFKGVEILELKQSAAWETEFDLTIDDDKIYMVCPAAGKLVKTVLEGNTISRVSEHAQNADLRSVATMGMSYGSAIATGALAGIITL